MWKKSFFKSESHPLSRSLEVCDIKRAYDVISDFSGNKTPKVSVKINADIYLHVATLF